MKMYQDVPVTSARIGRAIGIFGFLIALSMLANADKNRFMFPGFLLINGFIFTYYGARSTFEKDLAVSNLKRNNVDLHRDR